MSDPCKPYAPVDYSFTMATGEVVELVRKSELEVQRTAAEVANNRAKYYENLYREAREAFHSRKRLFRAQDAIVVVSIAASIGFLIWLSTQVRVPIN